MSDCMANHEECEEPIRTQLPKRIIDLGQNHDNNEMKLVETSRSTSTYAALSHCWGKHCPLSTTTSSLSLRKQKLEWISLPSTFKDAVTVTRRLGLRYLWIDSLCIIQDDNVDWQTESAKMGAYYRNAHIVIAASSSPDPTYSFLGPRQTAVPHPFKLDIQHDDGSICKIRARPVVKTGLSLDPLDKRAWTFQEQYLAIRLLRFTGSELVWNCRTRASCECRSRHLSTPGDAINMMALGRYCTSITNAYPAQKLFTMWQGMIYSYTRRQLTKRSDKLPAISGIAALVQQRTGSSYIAGLWKDNIVHDLRWNTAPSMISFPNFSTDVPANHDITKLFDFPQLRTS
ncbi:HET-domain-containing protein, partial [Trematosphaeria pertusa]